MIRVWLVTLGNFNYNLLNLKKSMKKKWAGMLMGMCAVVLSFSLAGCGKDDVVTENTIVEGDSVIITTVPVSFNLQAEGASRALGGVNFDEFDVYAYIFQAEDKFHDGGLLGEDKWNNEWSAYEFVDISSEKSNPKLITENHTEINLPVTEKNKNTGFLQWSDVRYKYKIVFLAAPKGSSVFPKPEKNWETGDLNSEGAYHEFPYEEDKDGRIAKTNVFNWYAGNEADGIDNAIYRDMEEVNPTNVTNVDDVKFTTDEIDVALYHKDGVLRVTVAQDLLPENVRSKAVKAELTIGNVPEQMCLKGSSSPDDDEVYCEGTQSLTKPFEGIDFSSGDVELEIHSLPLYPNPEATGGISCKVRLLDDADNELASNSFDSNADVYIYPNTISNVRLTKTGFEFGIDLEDDVWDGPNAANDLN